MLNKWSKLKSEEKGFTLIELIIVIVILGIISSVAMPKFIGLSDDARFSSARGVGGAMSASITTLHTDFLINGNDYDVDDVIANTVFGGGVTVGNAANVITFSSGGKNYVWDYADKVDTFSGFLTEDSSSEFP
jgi:prepilin-type N-terminal cleavage/methylation domain-containing protein